MKRNRTGIVVWLLAVVAVLGLLSGCSDALGGIQGYSFADGLTPETAEGLGVYAILIIDPPVNGDSVIVTDADGYFDMSGVPTGTYTLTPLYAPAEWAVEVRVDLLGSPLVTVPTPPVGLNLLDVHCQSAVVQLQDAEVRGALSASIDRSAVATLMGQASATSFFPEGLDISGFLASLDEVPNADLAAGNAATGAVTPFSLELLFNDNDELVPFRDYLDTAIGALNVITDVTVRTLPFADFLDERAAGNYEVSRFGWALDSNNLAQYLEIWRTGGWTRYANSAFDAELDAAHAAIAAGNIDGYETHLVAAHNILVGDLPSIPVYYL